MNKPYPIPEIMEHARKEKKLNKECCGLIIIVDDDYEYIPCNNFARNPSEDFYISHDDYFNASLKGEVVCVVHSHPDKGSAPSDADIYSHNNGSLAWLIVGFAGSESIRIMEKPAEIIPLTGRKFIHGVSDCWSVCRDFYRMNGIELPNYERQNEWWNKGQNLYEDLFEQTGFELVNNGELLYGDFLLMNIGSPVCNHAAVYCGNNKIVHHLSGRISEESIYGNFYRERTRYHLRHKLMFKGGKDASKA